ncbi:MAG TPA: phasin [Mesorhizobium sp.]|jgi:phasin|nr:phasin [Mesorhizobium sp.]
MPKAAENAAANTAAASNVEFPTFDANQATDQFRVFTEKGLEQSKEVYSRMKHGAEWAQKSMETTVETTRAASGELSLKAIAAMRSNVDAGFSHLEALVSAKTLSEVMELQGRFVRARFEAMLAQGKDMQSAASKAAEDMSRPVKDGFESALRELKVA